MKELIKPGVMDTAMQLAGDILLRAPTLEILDNDGIHVFHEYDGEKTLSVDTRLSAPLPNKGIGLTVVQAVLTLEDSSGAIGLGLDSRPQTLHVLARPAESDPTIIDDLDEIRAFLDEIYREIIPIEKKEVTINPMLRNDQHIERGYRFIKMFADPIS